MTNLFFFASKTIGIAARAETWLLLLMAFALRAQWRKRTNLAFGLMALTFLLTLTLTSVPLGDLLLTRLERQFPANPPLTHVDDIIVLGGDEAMAAYERWGGIQVNDAGERLIAAVILAQRFPEAKLVYTGGSAGLRSDASPGSPSQMMYDAWVALGVAPERIVLERASRNTSENAVMTRVVVQPKAGQIHLLVTSGWHMPRAMETFTRAGWTGMVAWPVDFRSGALAGAPGWRLDENLSGLDTALKEYLGLLVYRIAGK